MAAVATLVPDADKSTVLLSWRDTACASASTSLYSPIQEDIDSPTELACGAQWSQYLETPNNTGAAQTAGELELSTISPVQTATAIAVRTRGQKTGPRAATVAVEVRKADNTLLGAATSHALTQSVWNNYSYNLSSLTLSQAEVDGLYVRVITSVTGGGGGTAVNISTINLDVTYTIDPDVPTITDNQGGDTAWRRTNTGAYDIDFADDVDLASFDVKAHSTVGQGGTLLQDWTSAGTLSGTSFTTDWSLPASTWASLQQGTNHISVRVHDGNPKTSTLIDGFYVRKDTGGPTAPTGLGGATPTTSWPTLSWTASTDVHSGVSHYRVYRSPPACNDWYEVTSGDGATSTSFTDRTAVSGATYCYRVTAQDMAGNEGTASTTHSIVFNTAAAAAVVEGTWVVPGNTTATISWERSLGSTSYRVYRSATEGGVYALIGSITDPNTSYVDTGLTNGNQYWYKVRGYNGAAESGDPVETLTNVGTFAQAGMFSQCHAVVNGRAYMLARDNAGAGNQDIWRFDPLTNTMSLLPDTLDQGRNWCGATDFAGSIYVMGGGGGMTTSIYKYTPGVGGGVVSGTMSVGRRENATFVLPDNRIYSVGGWLSTFVCTSEVLAYDPVADTNTTVVGNLPVVLCNPSGGTVDVSGFSMGGGASTNASRIDVPGTVTARAPLGAAQGQIGGTGLNDRLYLFGGQLLNGQIQRYDNRSDTYTTLATTIPNSPRQIATPAIRGYIYLIGGRTSGGWTNQILRFSPGGAARAVPAVPAAGAPTALGVTASFKQASLTWTGAANVHRYRVYRSDTSGVRGALIEEQMGLVDAPTVVIVDRGLACNTTFYYTIDAIGFDHRASAATAQVSDTTPICDVTPPTVPTSLANASQYAPPALTWTASTDAGGTGVAYYRVFRSSGDCTGAYTQINLDGATTTEAYSDLGALIGSPHCYRVVAVDNSGNDSAQSAVLSTAYSNSPTFDFLTGFEHGVMSHSGQGLFGDIDNAPGLPTIVTSPRHSGQYAAETLGNPAVARIINYTTGTPEYLAMRVAFRADQLPDANQMPILDISALGQLGDEAAYLRLNSNGTNFVQIGYSGATAAGPTLVPDTWYVFDFEYDIRNPNAWQIRWRVNGVPYPTITRNMGISTTIEAYMIGDMNGAAVETFYWDDWAMTTTIGDYPLGDGEVVAVAADGRVANGSDTNFSDEIGGVFGALSHLKVDDVPMVPITDYVRQDTDTTGNAFAELSMADPVTAAAPRGVRGIGAYHTEAGGAATASTRFRSGATETAVFTGAMGTALIRYKGGMVTPPGGSWAKAEVDALTSRVGYATSITGKPAWDSIIAEVEYPPGSLANDLNAPTAPTNLANASQYAPPALSWTASTDVGGSGMAYYRVFRASGDCTGGYVQVNANGATSGTTYTDAAATIGDSYCYLLRAVDGAGNVSVNSTVLYTAYTTAPTFDALTGFEHGVVSSSGGGLFSSISFPASVSISSAIRRTGDYGLRVNHTGTSTSANRTLSSASNMASLRVAARIEAFSSPATTHYIATIGATTGGWAFVGIDTTTERFYVTTYDAGESARQYGPPVTLGEWYVIDMRYTPSIPNGRTVEWRIDGIPQPTLTVNVAASQAIEAELGVNGGSQIGGDNYYDDFAVSIVGTDYPIGDGVVYGVGPDGRVANGSDVNFSDEGGGAFGATSHLKVDDVPMIPIADYVRQDTDTTGTAFADLSLADPAPTATARGVRGIVGYHTEGGLAATAATRFRSGATETSVFSGAMGAATIRYRSGALTAPGGGWTKANLDALTSRVGYATAITGKPAWDSVMAEIEYPPLPAQPDTPSNTSPANGSASTDTTPTLTSSAFSDPDSGDTHSASQWQVTTTAGDYAAPAVDSGTDAVNLTSFTTGALIEGVYYFHVRHRDSPSSTWSSYSTESSFIVDVANPPAVATLAGTSPTTSWPALTWSNVVDITSGVAFYRVYRSPAGCALWSQVSTEGGPDGGAYSDESAIAGNTYCYKVRAVDHAGNEATDSNVVTIVFNLAATASPVKGSWVVAGDTRTSVTWQRSIGSTSYRIYRSTISGTLGALIATVNDPATSFVDTALVNGTQYYYTVRGYNGSTESSDPVEALDLVTTMSAGTSFEGCRAEIDGKIYLFGGTQSPGVGQAWVWMFDPATGQVSDTGYTLPQGMNDCGASDYDGTAYIFGGSATGTNNTTDKIAQFTPGVGVVARTAVLPTPRWEVAAATLANGKIYLYGGHQNATIYNTIHSYDPAAPDANPTSVGTMSTVRSGVGAAVFEGNTVILPGGQVVDPLTSTAVTDRDAVIFGPESHTVTTRAPLGVASYGTNGTAVLNDKAVVYCGGGATGRVRIFDERANTWSTGAAQWAGGSCTYVAARRIRGFVYGVGGWTAGCCLNQVYRYSPAGQARGVPGAPLAAPPTAPAAVVSGPSSITVSWTAGAAVRQYRVFRSTVSGQIGQLVEEQMGMVSAPSTQLVDNALPCTTYYYTIDAYGYDDRGTTATAEVSATLNCEPDAPSNTAPAAGSATSDTTPTLTSTAFSDFNVADVHSASQWQVTTTAGDYSSPTVDSGTDLVNKTSYTTAALSEGLHYFRVRHRDTIGPAWSSYSVETSFRVDTTPPTAPTGLTLTGTQYAAPALSWTASTDIGGSGVAYYRVMRSSGDCSGAYAQINVDGATTGTTYTDAAAVVGNTYCYRVVAVDNAALASVVSTTVVTAFSTQPTFDFLSGFEHGAMSTAGGGIFDSMSGAPVVSSQTIRNGSFSLRTDGAAGATHANVSMAGTMLVGRLAFRFDTLPTGTNFRIFDGDVASGSDLKIRYRISDGAMIADIGPTSIASNVIISAGTWYVLDLRFDTSGATRRADWRINGIVQPEVTNVEPSSAVTFARFGPAAGAVGTAFIDDAALSGTSTDYPIGDGRVVALHADGRVANGSDINFTNELGGPFDALSFLRVFESPMTPIDQYIRQDVVNAGAYAELSLENPTETTTARGVSGVAAYHTEGGAGATASSRFRSGATETDLFTGAMGSASIVYRSAVLTPPGGGWTQANLDALTSRVGYASAITGKPAWDSVVAEVEYPPLIPQNLAIRVDGYDVDGTGPHTAPATIDLSTVLPLTPVFAELRAVVTTDAANGYALSLHDPDANGALSTADLAASVPWNTSGTIAAPATWAGTGIAISAFGGDETPARWCNGGQVNCTAKNDGDLFWAEVTGASEQISGKSSSVPGGDTTRIPYRAEFAGGQAAGAYSGMLTLTATAVP